ncbi:flagellin [uncultured Devosia sp.]|uniref:flagellin N-terminal helical domain-containing protein n=1 Tax=uncultured Devosia sp. TaxID=211434 RepID=UPI0026179DEC|nr:flagellin [uncultured Devosia sp.]
MPEVNLSKAVRSNLLSLQSTAASMAKTQERLATGLKVNSALDNPTNFFTASSLNSRASDMANLLDSMSNGIKTIEAADNGLSSITKTVESMQSALRQARQDKSFKTGSYALNLGATPAGTEALSLSGGAIGTTPVSVSLTTLTGGTTVPASNALLTGTSALTPLTFTAAGPNTNAVATGTSAPSSLDASAADITFDVNGQTVTLNAAGGTGGVYDATQLRDAINTQVGSSAGVAATIDGSGNLVVTSTGTAGASDAVDIDNFSAGTDATDLGFAAATVSASGTTGAAATSLSFDINGDTVTLNSAGGTGGTYSAAQIRDAINTQVGTSAGVAASLDTSGNLVITSTGTAGLADTVTLNNFSSGNASQLGFATVTSVTDAGTDATTTGAVNVAKSVDALVTEINANPALKSAIRASNDNGKLRIENLSTSELNIGGISTTGEATGAANTVSVNGNDVRKNLVKQFNELRDQLDKFADDASFNGINLLRGDKLKLTFNETGTSTIDIQAKDANGAATSVNNTSLGISTAVDSDFDSDSKIDAKLAKLGDALGTLRSQSSGFGSNLSIVQNRTDFTKKMINTLETGAANLTLADTNEEAANLLALQTRQQLSSTALSMASQADQAVLRLF